MHFDVCLPCRCFFLLITLNMTFEKLLPMYDKEESLSCSFSLDNSENPCQVDMTLEKRLPMYDKEESLI